MAQLLALPLQAMAATPTSTLEVAVGRRLAEGDATYGIAFGIFGFLLLIICPLTCLPRGYVRMWLKVHLATTNQSSVCWGYLPAETKELYQEQLANARGAGCCVWFKTPLVMNEDLVDAQTPAKVGTTGRFRGLALSVDIEADGGVGALAETTSVSGKPLGLIPASTESGSAVDLEYVRTKTRIKKQVAHHCSVMLPRDGLDGDDACGAGFDGFGEPDNPEAVLGRCETDASEREDPDEAPTTQFIFALLDERGRWLVDLPLDPEAGDIVMGRGFKYDHDGRAYELGGDGDLAISGKQMLVSAADGTVSATPLGPNPSFLQRPEGSTHCCTYSAPAQLPRGARVSVLPGDILWLCRGRYPLRLIERLPGNLSVAGGLQLGHVAAALGPAAARELAREEVAASKLQAIARGKKSRGFTARLKEKPPPNLAKPESSSGSGKRLHPPAEMPPGTGRQSIVDTREWVSMHSQKDLKARDASPKRQTSPTKRQQS